MNGDDAESLADAGALQARIFAFLAAPATYGLSPGTDVRRIDTHGAVVFLAGDDAYKVKRAVRFPFMDFSTLEKRRAACAHEIAVNRANAPQIYLGIVPIRAEGDALHLDRAQGSIVEWAVHLRRFDETQTFERLADRGALDPALMEALAATIAAAHRRAPKAVDEGGQNATAMLRKRLEDTLDGLAAASDIFPTADVATLRDRSLACFAAVEPLLQRRAASGQVRLCHGDLHLRNIVLHDGAPLLFDAIEFDDQIATCDILYDFAFVLMDLWQRGLALHASRLFNLYLWQSEDIVSAMEGLAALPLFLALRAAIRARVTVALARLEPEGREARLAEAWRFFAAAQSFLSPAPPRLVAIGGLSGSGKSTLAMALAPALGRAPGAAILRSDIERKRLFQRAASESLPKEAYAPDVTVKVYARLRALAEAALKSGQSVILDAVHAKEEERKAAEAVAAAAHVPFAGIWLDAPEATLIARADGRDNDASDAKASVVREQLGYDLGCIGWQQLDAGRKMADLAQEAMTTISGSDG